MTTRISDFIASYIEKQKVKHIFLVSGSANVYLLEAIKNNPKLEYICNHHEQASAMSAEAYSRINRNFGVCLVTTGPGGTNTITGVTGAWLDSVPVLYISAQVKSGVIKNNPQLRQVGVQEINITDIVKPITKYAVTITDPQKILYHLEKATFLAKEGRPGPVWLDIPIDIQEAIIDEKKLQKFIPSKQTSLLTKQLEINIKLNIPKIIFLLKKAKKPLLFIGRGVEIAKSKKELLKLIENLKIPVFTAMNAHDLISSDNDFLCGRPGIFGDRGANLAIQDSDLILSIGARMHLWNIGFNYKNFAPKAKKIIVDIDQAELRKKTIIPDLAIHADAGRFIIELNNYLKKTKLPNYNIWFKKCHSLFKKYPVVLPEYKNPDNYVNSYNFVDILSEKLTDDDIIVTGNGTAFTCTYQTIRLKKKQRLLYNVGCSSMGYGLPAAVGAYYASLKDRIILITGDGSIMMNLQELETISHHKIPVKIFLLNNQCYLAIKNTQTEYFGKNFTASDKNSGISFPDFEKIAYAFNIPYIKIKKKSRYRKEY